MEKMITISNVNYYEYITEKCTEFYLKKERIAPAEMANLIMHSSDFPIHSPHHHYIVPAVLLTAACIEQSVDETTFLHELRTAAARARTIPGAMCGEFGVCGAAVGNGIFACLWLDTTPQSKENLGLVNLFTADGLTAIGQCPGPRCCKRFTFLAIEAAVKRAEQIGLHLEEAEISCGFFEKNEECIGDECTYYKKR